MHPHSWFTQLITLLSLKTSMTERRFSPIVCEHVRRHTHLYFCTYRFNHRQAIKSSNECDFCGSLSYLFPRAEFRAAWLCVLYAYVMKVGLSAKESKGSSCAFPRVWALTALTLQHVSVSHIQGWQPHYFCDTSIKIITILYYIKSGSIFEFDFDFFLDFWKIWQHVNSIWKKCPEFSSSFCQIPAFMKLLFFHTDRAAV